MYVGYIRVSTDEQSSNTSLAYQREAITHYCSFTQTELIAIYEDVGTGATLERPGLSQALAALPVNGALIVAKADRLSRSVIHGLTILDRLLNSARKLVTLDINVDLSTSMGRYVFSIVLSGAEFERANILERTDNGRRKAKHDGRHAGGAPSYGHTVTDGVVSLVENEQATIRFIKQLWKTGRTYEEIANELSAKNIPTKRGGVWRKSTVHKIMQRILTAMNTDKKPGKKAEAKKAPATEKVGGVKKAATQPQQKPAKNKYEATRKKHT